MGETYWSFLNTYRLSPQHTRAEKRYEKKMGEYGRAGKLKEFENEIKRCDKFEERAEKRAFKRWEKAQQKEERKFWKKF